MFFFGFLEVFGTFGQKQKTLEKAKKNKKNITLDTIWLPPCSLWSFFLFSLFSRGFWHLGSKTKKTRENKKQKKQNSRHYMATPLAPCSLWSFFFWFARGFWHFGSNTKKRGEQWQRVGSCHFFCCLFFLFSFIFLENQQK